MKRQYQITYRRHGKTAMQDDFYRLHASNRRDAIAIAAEYLQADYGLHTARNATLIDAELMPHERT